MRLSSPLRRLLLGLLIISLSLVVILSLKRWVVEGYEVPTTSMMPTLRPGDRVWVNKLAYRKKSPQRGDMVVFPQPGTGVLYVKRVVAFPGERITVLGRMVYIAGQPMETIVSQDEGEVAVWGSAWPEGSYMSWAKMPDTGALYRLLHPPISIASWRQSGSWLVPQGHLFVLGDSRDDSSDSRSWGSVSQSSIVGKVVCRVDAGSRSEFPIAGRTNCSPDNPMSINGS